LVDRPPEGLRIPKRGGIGRTGVGAWPGFGAFWFSMTNSGTAAAERSIDFPNGKNVGGAIRRLRGGGGGGWVGCFEIAYLSCDPTDGEWVQTPEGCAMIWIPLKLNVV